MTHTVRWLIAGAVTVAAGTAMPLARAAAPFPFQNTQDWCANAGNDDRRSETFCEVRELTPGRLTSLEATGNPNGSIRVTGGSRQDVRIQARVVAHGDSMDEARAMAKDVRIAVEGGRLVTGGPNTRGRRYWQVSYRIETPRNIDLTMDTANGSLDISNVNGRVRATSSNGSVRLSEMAGDVQARTSNGSVNVTLSGTTWEGAGLEATTSNGSVRAEVPDNYNARLVASTSNGGLNIDFPVTIQGRISGRNPTIDAPIGKGGPTIRLESSNGSISVRRR